jgi:large repetitive protein
VRGRSARALGGGVFAVIAALAVVQCERLPEIPNVPPIASFVYSPVSPINSGQTVVTFIASGSTDADGQIASYTWNFGDGTPEETRTTPTATHLFPDTPATCLEIVYTVLLTVTDDEGAKASASQTARVTELPPPTSIDCTRR